MPVPQEPDLATESELGHERFARRAVRTVPGEDQDGTRTLVDHATHDPDHRGVALHGMHARDHRHDGRIRRDAEPGPDVTTRIGRNIAQVCQIDAVVDHAYPVRLQRISPHRDFHGRVGYADARVAPASKDPVQQSNRPWRQDLIMDVEDCHASDCPGHDTGHQCRLDAARVDHAASARARQCDHTGEDQRIPGRRGQEHRLDSTGPEALRCRVRFTQEAGRDGDASESEFRQDVQEVRGDTVDHSARIAQVISQVHHGRNVACANWRTRCGAPRNGYSFSGHGHNGIWSRPEVSGRAPSLGFRSIRGA